MRIIKLSAYRNFMKKTTIGGELGKFYRAIYENFFKKVDVRHHVEAYRGIHDKLFAEPEFAGKFMDICATYYETTGDESALKKAEEVLVSVAENQREDGYLGTYARADELEMFSLWNQAFTMLGLLRIYETSGNETALHVSVRCADWIVRRFTSGGGDILDAFNGGTQHISVLLPLAKLYGVTKNEKYRMFIDDVLARMENSRLNLLSFRTLSGLQSQKGIELFVVWLGLLEIFRQNGDGRILSAAKRYWRLIAETQIRNTGNGTIDEVWTEGGAEEVMIPLSARPNENCVAVGWLEFSLALFFLQPDMRYLDAVEKTLFNHLIGSLSEDGSDFAYYQATFGQKVYQTADYAYKCCRYRGVSAFAYLPEYLFFDSGGEIVPLVYTKCSYESEDVCIDERTDYPEDGAISFSLLLRREKILKLRIPDWCKKYSVVCDGTPREETTLELMAGKHEVLLNLQFPLNAIYTQKDGGRVSFTYGPLLLAADEECCGFNPEAFVAVPSAIPEKDGRLFRLKGTLDGEPAEAILTDYSAAGRKNAGHNAFLIWIRTAAE